MKQLHKISFLLLTLACFLVVLWACKRTVKNDEILGNANLKSAPADFSGITNSSSVETWAFRELPPNGLYPQKVVNKLPVLKTGTGNEESVSIRNTFSHEVTWFVSFTGRTSSAVATFTGTGDKVDENDFRFRGIPNNGETRLFLKGEIVDLKLSFLGSTTFYVDSVQFTSTGAALNGYIDYKVLDNGDTLFYYKIDDFETAGGIQTSYADQADGNDKAAFYVNNKNSVSGNFQFYMKGTDANGNNYCGGSSHEALVNQMAFAAHSDDPSKVFINAYIYGYGRSNSSLFFQVFENDFADPKTNTWPAPRALDKNDMWYTIVEVDWVGWKLVSVPYSSFKPASNPLSGGGGNRIKEPKKISAFGIELESYPTPGKTVELGLDLVTLTTNAPFQP